jgi:Molecular chaperone (small heat shock protein)
MAKELKSTEKEERPLVRRGSGLMSFQDIERWFDEVFSRRWLHPSFDWRGPAWSEFKTPFESRRPKVDVIDRENAIVIRAELPGVSKDDLDVSMADNCVTIKATTHHEEKEEKGEYYYCEMSRGEFQRSLTLPAEVRGDQAKASFKDGILELILPKAEQTKRKSIKVE